MNAKLKEETRRLNQILKAVENLPPSEQVTMLKRAIGYVEAGNPESAES